MSQPPIVIHPVPPQPTGPPTYVEHGGELSNRHPAEAKDARLYGFILEADGARLDAWCDLCLNEPSGGAERWQAAGDFVLLDFIKVRTLQSSDPLDAPLGYTSEQEVAIWMPVMDLHRGRVAWTVPYIWVDSGYAMAGGRETYGFPKQLGTPKIPNWTGQAPDKLTLEAVTLRTFDPLTAALAQPVVSAERPGTASTLSPTWADLGAGMTHFLGLAGSPTTTGGYFADPLGALATLTADYGTAVLFLAGLFTRSLPVVLLKQFRDAAHPGAACYQAVVEVETRLDRFGGGGLLPDDYTVTFHDLAGVPVHRELGLPTGPLVPAAAFWLEFDFTVLLGRILWEA